MKAACVINSRKKNIGKILANTLKVLKKYRISSDVFEEVFPWDDPDTPIKKLPRYDLVITLGGDETLLRACRVINVHDTPVIGVNMGTLGFITDIKVGEIASTIRNIISKKQYFQKRILMGAVIKNRGKIIADWTGLNDVVLTSGEASRILSFVISVNNCVVNKCRSDGLVIATPTGSTGHAMSAGGPIVHPELKDLIMIPICPHTLTNRPIMIPGSQSIHIRLQKKSQYSAVVTVDGQRSLPFDTDCEAVIKVSPYFIRLAAESRDSYWDILKSKLGWRGTI